MFLTGNVHLTWKVQKQFQSMVSMINCRYLRPSQLLNQVHFYLFSLSIGVKLSVVYLSKICLVALMLLSLQIIGPFMKTVSDCSRKSSFPTLKLRKKSLITQRSCTHWSWWIPLKVKITPKLKHYVRKWLRVGYFAA